VKVRVRVMMKVEDKVRVRVSQLPISCLPVLLLDVTQKKKRKKKRRGNNLKKLYACLPVCLVALYSPSPSCPALTLNPKP
jgi:hypothetical protein